VLAHPRREFFARHHASGERKNYPFLIIQSSGKIETIEHEGNFQGCVTDALVAIDKWTVLHQKESQRRSFLRDGWIQTSPPNACNG
jgi:hypothetical protein